jgi:hypothetical protein
MQVIYELSKILFFITKNKPKNNRFFLSIPAPFFMVSKTNC